MARVNQAPETKSQGQRVSSGAKPMMEGTQRQTWLAIRNLEHNLVGVLHENENMEGGSEMHPMRRGNNDEQLRNRPRRRANALTVHNRQTKISWFKLLSALATLGRALPPKVPVTGIFKPTNVESASHLMVLPLARLGKQVPEMTITYTDGTSLNNAAIKSKILREYACKTSDTKYTSPMNIVIGDGVAENYRDK
ncbi:hypothetical protein RF11_15871 [Thelohanellus kitauei]|uniref:Uncharacterized protein n=1 Tax=Thelohanellus kitauei TaxID=669202 RepID=A0A0C2N1Q2_THEKT|nr:hypothetical protein RF11_15871 [Thelohanellus kitauei]